MNAKKLEIFQGVSDWTRKRNMFQPFLLLLGYVLTMKLTKKLTCGNPIDYTEVFDFLVENKGSLKQLLVISCATQYNELAEFPEVSRTLFEL